MKKLCFLPFFLLSVLFITAQNCTPDSQYVSEGPGVYPDSIVGLPPAYTCQPYSAVITIVVPYDTVYNGQYMLIDSAVLKSVDDLPPNFSYACEPPDCNFPGGTAGCIVLTGFPALTDTGDYVPVGNVLGYVDAFPGAGIPFPKIDYYIIDINPGGGPIVASVVNSSPISCNSGCDGQLTLAASCGFPPYSFLWSNGQTTQTASGLCAGNHSVTVSDSSGSSVLNYSMGEPASLSLNFVQSPPTNGCNGSITVNPSGGTAPYSYNWTTGDTTQVINSLCSGFYQVTVTDGNGCAPVVNAVYLPVGVDEATDAGLPFRIYPNPNNGKFYIENISIESPHNSGFIFINNFLGEPVFKSRIDNKKSEIDLSFLPQGQYFFQVVTAKDIFNKKMIIVR